MIDPIQPDDLFSAIARAIGVPPPQGRARPAVACLTVWLFGNFVWLAAGVLKSFLNSGYKAPPGWTYWILWCLVAGPAGAALLIRFRRPQFSGWLWFFGFTLAMCILEEVLCYVTGTGMWESRTRFWPEIAVAIAVLMSWSIGTALVMRHSGLPLWPALLLCGLSGWIAEAFMVPRFDTAPVLMIWIIPLSILSYLLLILPGLAAVSPALSRLSVNRRPQLREYLAALFGPVACSILAAVLISRFLGWS